MIQTKSLFSYCVTAAVVMLVVAVTTLSIDTAMNAYAQNMTTRPAAPPAEPGSGMLGAFYYPWYGGSTNAYRHWSEASHIPTTSWASNFLPDTIQGFGPATELYNSNDQVIINKHIADMSRAGIDFGISSWWGQNSYEDIAFKKILASPNGAFKWAILYEQEGFGNPSTAQLVSDLNYIKNTLAVDPDYLKINGRPVVFVYNAAHTGSNALEDHSRWSAARTQTNVNVVFKIDALTAGAPVNSMDGWYQYDPAVPYEQHGSHSAFISPGFTKYDEPVRLARDFARFNTDIARLADANVAWKTIQTFNEMHEGTQIEPANQINHNHAGQPFTQIVKSYCYDYLNAVAREFGGQEQANPNDCLNPSASPTPGPTPKPSELITCAL